MFVHIFCDDGIIGNLEIAKEQVEKPFEHKEHLLELLSEQTELNAELDLDKKDEIIAGDDGCREYGYGVHTYFEAAIFRYCRFGLAFIQRFRESFPALFKRRT